MLIDWVYQGQTYKVIAFKLPPSVAISAPIAGQIGKATAGAPYTGLYASLRSDRSDPASPNYVFIGAMSFETMLSEEVQPGQIIAYTSDEPVIIFSEYNLIFRVTAPRTDGLGFQSDMQALSRLFPALSAQPASKTIEQTTPVERVVINIYE